MSTIASTTGSAYYGGVAAAPKKGMDMQMFLSLLTVQLRNQDPTQPMSNSEFAAQIAQLGQVQGMNQLNLDSQVQKAQALMGKTVTATRPYVPGQSSADTTVTGTVVQLSVRNGINYLGIQDPKGGIVDASLDGIQSVVPTPDLTQYAGLIGKTAGGSASVSVGGVTRTVSAIGQILGVSSLNGQTVVNVKTSEYGIVQIAVNELQHIAS